MRVIKVIFIAVLWIPEKGYGLAQATEDLCYTIAPTTVWRYTARTMN